MYVRACTNVSGVCARVPRARVRVCAFVCDCGRACVCVCVCVHVRAYDCVCAGPNPRTGQCSCVFVKIPKELDELSCTINTYICDGALHKTSNQSYNPLLFVLVKTD